MIGPRLRSFRTEILEPAAANDRNQKRAPDAPGVGDDTRPIPPSSCDSATPVSVAVESTAAVAASEAVKTSVNTPGPAGLIASFSTTSSPSVRAGLGPLEDDGVFGGQVSCAFSFPWSRKPTWPSLPYVQKSPPPVPPALWTSAAAR